MALNFPPSDASPYTAPNGVIYTWNTDGYWEAKADPADLDTDYLKLDASNDPVTGTCEFAAGVSVTGGTVNSTVKYANSYTGDAPNHLHIANPTINNTVTNGALKNYSSTVGDVSGTALGEVAHFFANINGTKNFTTVPDKQYGYFVRGLDQATNNYGFYSDMGESTKGFNTYNFYASGEAPNYFRGNIKIAYDPAADTLNPRLADNTGIVQIQPAGYVQISRRSGNTEDGCIVMRRASKSDGLFMRFESAAGADTDWSDEAVFRLNGYGGGVLGQGFSITTFSIDNRLQSNVQSISNASALVQQLNPVSFTNVQTGNVETNFTSSEVEAVAPQAIHGAQDATEAIGTLLDWDGTELETDVTEPDELTYEEEVESTPYAAAVAATYDEYGNELTAEVPEVEATYTTVTRTKTWSSTGTRDVYQGVDQTKLIPLLTKALQEALDRIEQLESNTLQPLYATLADLPSATDHHGKVAHVHSEGALYFAHAGNWVKLQNA